MWPFKAKEPIPEVKPETRDITLCRVTSINNNYDYFWLKPEDAKAIRQAEGKFIDITFYWKAYKRDPDKYFGKIFLGFVQGLTVSFNVNQITHIAPEFNNKELLNYEALRDYLKATTCERFDPGAWTSA